MPLTLEESRGDYHISLADSKRAQNLARKYIEFTDAKKENTRRRKAIGKSAQSLLAPVFAEHGLDLAVVEVNYSGHTNLELHFRKFGVVSSGGTNKQFLDATGHRIIVGEKDEHVEHPTPRNANQFAEFYASRRGRNRTGELVSLDKADLLRQYRSGDVTIVPGSDYIPLDAGETLRGKHRFGYKLTADVDLGQIDMDISRLKVEPQYMPKEYGHQETLTVGLDVLIAMERNGVSSHHQGQVLMNYEGAKESLHLARSFIEGLSEDRLGDLGHARLLVNGNLGVRKQHYSDMYHQLLMHALRSTT